MISVMIIIPTWIGSEIVLRLVSRNELLMSHGHILSRTLLVHFPCLSWQVKLFEMGCLYAFLGGVGGAALFFLLPIILLGGNLSGLVGLMVVPVGFIVGAAAGGIYWAERPSKKAPRNDNDSQ